MISKLINISYLISYHNIANFMKTSHSSLHISTRLLMMLLTDNACMYHHRASALSTYSETPDLLVLILLDLALVLSTVGMTEGSL